MEDKYFINRYFEEELEEYINCEKNKEKHRESFNYYVILMLIELFGDLDLINPFITQNQKTLIDNMSKYGYSRSDILVFFDSFEKFNEINVTNINVKNPYFVKVQKELIDMFFQKKHCVELNDNRKFYSLLFTPNNGNINKVNYNKIMCNDEFEIDDYFKKKLFEFENPMKSRPVIEIFEEEQIIKEENNLKEKKLTLASARGNVNILIILLTTAVVGLALAIINLIVG